MTGKGGRLTRVAACGMILAIAAYIACLVAPLVTIDVGEGGLTTQGSISAREVVAKRGVASQILANPEFSEAQVLRLLLTHGVGFEGKLPNRTLLVRRLPQVAAKPGDQAYAPVILAVGCGVVLLAFGLLWMAWGLASEPVRGRASYAGCLVVAAVLAAFASAVHLGLNVAVPYANAELQSVTSSYAALLGPSALVARAPASYALPIVGVSLVVLALVALVARPSTRGTVDALPGR